MMMGIVAGQMRRSQEAPGYLLDDYPGAFLAFSAARKLRHAYDGPCIQVRRVADNALLDVGFDASGNIDVASLMAFAGSGTAMVSRWYDQSVSYSENIAGQRYLQNDNTPFRQPAIVTAGVLHTMTGRPAAKFSGAQGLYRQSIAETQAGVYSRTVLCAFRNDGAEVGVLYETGGANAGNFASDRAGILLDVNEHSAGSLLFAGSGSVENTYVWSSSASAAIGKDTVFCAVFDQDGIGHATEFPEFRVDGVDGYSSAGGTSGVTPIRFASAQFSVGSRGANSPSLHFTGLIAELVVYEGRAYGADNALDGNLINFYSQQ